MEEGKGDFEFLLGLFALRQKPLLDVFSVFKRHKDRTLLFLSPFFTITVREVRFDYF